MIANLLLGTLVICLTILIHTFGLLAVHRSAQTLAANFRMHGQVHRVVVMIGIVLGLFAVITVEIWLWAGLYTLAGVATDFSSALYLSTVTFSTVGYGDIVPSANWRMLGALEGITGFLVIGWSTAFLVTAGTRLGPFRSGEHF